MKISNSISVNANLSTPDNALIGISTETGECTGCGEEVHILRFGLLFGEVYFTHYKH